MKKKTVSEVVSPNLINGKDSNEPRNAAGERAIPKKKKVTRSVVNANRRNPWKTGLFSRELILTDREKVEFQKMVRALQLQRQPSTELQHIGLDGIACCCWRCKLAIRREMQKLSALLDPPNGHEVRSEGSTDPNTAASSYPAGRQELNSTIRWLREVLNDFEVNGVVRPEWKKPMDSVSGPEFYESLTKWTPMHFQAILAAMSMDMHAKTYGLGDLPLGVEESSRVTIDPNQGREMAIKLIRQELRHLADRRSWEQATESAKAQNGASVDFWRYYTTASRDLQRAVDWYLYLKENEL